MQNQPNSIMLFAAGFGSRMGSLTNNTPKPLLEVSGKTLLSRSLEIVSDANIANTVVNTHYLANEIHTHLCNTNVKISHEKDAILETGGGIKNALPLLGQGPIFTLNPDVVWNGENPLSVLSSAWNSNTMDGLLLLIPTQKARSYNGNGDFSVLEDSQIIRGSQGVYSGAQIINPKRLDEIHNKSFSLNLLWDKLIQSKSLYGVMYSNDWCDVGSPQGIELAELMLAEKHGVC